MIHHIYCMTCGLELDSAEMPAHLRDVHGVDPKTQQFKKEFISHLDQPENSVTTYRWECDKVVFMQVTVAGREKNDMMRGEAKE